MSTPDDAITQEPDRFADNIDLDKISKAKNPQKEFLKQMEKRWNRKAGLYMWRYFVEKYDLVNAVYNSKKVQNPRYNLNKGLDKQLFEKYMDNFKEKIGNFQIKIDQNRVRMRAKGIKISPYKYNDLQKSFILSKKDMPLKLLSSEFNRYFKAKLSRNAIRDKRLRLLGKK
jgi:hypothetical protein